MISHSLIRSLREGLALACLLAFLTAPVVTFADQAPLRIPRVNRAPKLTDFINGSPREAEAVVTEFRQFDPHDGEPISQPTAAYLSYDSKNLYIGWICKDDPSRIRARVAPRKQIDTDDRISIVIDTFGDHKHGYWFDTNPYGIQFDGRTTDGIGDDPSWEALWYTEGKITSDGYVVLQTIPFRSLRFPRASKQIWYISLARMIQRTNEYALWPFVSHQRLPQFVGQNAPIEIDEDISAGRNFQLIPYGLLSSDKYLDDKTGFKQQEEHHVGLDAKMVIHDALTLDMTLNPDFSEIGTDDPKVKANQRYEVIYPERRPFFLENASAFSTPEFLFFSRRIVDPQYGAKLTGTLGRWNLGAIAADDRAPGEVLVQGESGHGDRAADEIIRGEREFGHQSHVGMFVSNSNFDSTWNRVGSIDVRLLAHHNWSFAGQATVTQNQDADGKYLAGRWYSGTLTQSGTHVNFVSDYTNRSPGVQVPLGYVSRVDVRNWENYYSYQWKPKAGHKILSFGPSIDTSINYDYEHRLENWYVGPGFSLSLPKLTYLSVSHGEGYELYKGIGFRERNTNFNIGTSWYKWLQLNATYGQGQQPNYYPPAGLQPFLGNANSASATLTLRPNPRLRLDQIYYYTRLETTPGVGIDPRTPACDVFTNHLIRSKVNYQFNRDYSFNAIFDYNSMLPNSTLVTNSYSKQADTTLLFTYLPHPGTAFYLGYADTFQNVDYSSAATPAYSTTTLPGTSTDRQFFMKVSYLLRF